ncbi:MAG: bifunctional histidine phosphatase family protein/GNAT family N-acetyltransferase [Oscillospiraceae bacterium]|nr:bifunctional histidine phosphatase family protein/GNAT family N-acetyltransferase [Oscillospiraceae bacterium]
MTRIYIIRHAEAEGNLYRRLHGQYNSLVTENGWRQIAALEKRFSQERIDACYASDLIRTRITAGAITRPKNLPLHQDSRFREVKMGVWEDVPFGEVGEKWPEQLNQFDTAPTAWSVEGAERYPDYADRFIAAMTESAEANPGKTIAIVSHGSVIRGMQMRLFIGTEHPELTGHCDNTGVTLLEYDNGVYRMIYKNDNSHLEESISTLAQQNWWKQDGKKRDHNLWYQPVGDDWRRYIAFRQEAWELIYGNLDGFSGEAFWHDASRCAENRPECLVFAMLGNQIAGLLQLDLQRKADRNAGYIPFFYLCPDFRCRGFGVQMVGHAISVCRPIGRKSIQLSVSPDNDRARRFYARCGFQEIGQSDGFCESLLLLEKQIAIEPYL